MTTTASIPMVAKIGKYVLDQLREARYLAAVMGTILWIALHPRYWVRTVRNGLARQILVMGVESLLFIAVVAVLVGIVLVVQVVFWVRQVGQSQLLGPLLVTVVGRELGPLFANFVLIVKSGSTMTTELGIMQVSGDVHTLEAQGIEPFTFLVLPRVLGAVVAALGLTVIFILVAFASGYGFGLLMGSMTGGVYPFVESVLYAVRPGDVIGILTKSILPALVTGVVCCTAGLSVTSSIGDVTTATQRALVRSVATLFLISALVSLSVYSLQ